MPFLLLSAFRGLVDSVHEHLAASGFPGITARHGFALQAIDHGCTSGEPGQRLGVSKQAAARTAQSLLDLGPIERTPSPDDRRARILTPIERGRTMPTLSAEAFAKELQHRREQCGDHDFEATLRTLATVDHGARDTLDLSDWE